MKRIAVYPGSFDPITKGHEDLIHRSLEFVDQLIVAVAINVAKQPLFSLEERVAMIRTAVPDKRVDVQSFDGLLAEFAKQVEATVKRHRSHIVEREYLQHRLADAAMDLYAMLATIARAASRFREEGADAASREIRLAKVFCEGAWRRVRRNLRAVESNQDEELDRIVADLRSAGGCATDLN